MKLKFLKFKFLLLLSALAFLLAYCSQSKTESKEAVSLYLNHNDTVKYVGINTCKQCHIGIYETFIKTGMGKSFDVASKQKSSAKLNQHTVIYDTSYTLNQLSD